MIDKDCADERRLRVVGPPMDGRSTEYRRPGIHSHPPDGPRRSGLMVPLGSRIGEDAIIARYHHGHAARRRTAPRRPAVPPSSPELVEQFGGVMSGIPGGA